MTKGTYKCASCSRSFIARTADRKRGWARFCSKSCKAIRQEQKTGQFAQFKGIEQESFGLDGDFNGGWGEHKGFFA